jgi:YaiO family outer membrane protein
VGRHEAERLSDGDGRRNQVSDRSTSRLIVPTIQFGLALAAALLLPTSAMSQETAPPWFAGIFVERDNFSGSSTIWTDWTSVRALAVRNFDRGSLGLEVASVERFDLSDQAVAGELYLELWDGAYAYLRGRVTPDAELLPKGDLRGEIFQSLGGGWEASANFWMMDVAGPNVTVGGLGLAKYQGQWFLRSQGNLARIAGESAYSGRVFARRFLAGSSREYFEVGTGTGKEVVVLGAGPVLDARNTWFVSGSHQRFLNEHFGFNLGVGVSDFEGVPFRRTLALGLISRF